jgi:hypothetical protein
LSGKGRCGMASDDDGRGFSRKELRWLGIGIEFAVVVCIFAYAGHWIDKLTGNEDAEFLITGFFIGFLVMFYYLYNATKELRK